MKDFLNPTWCFIVSLTFSALGLDEQMDCSPLLQLVEIENIFKSILLHTNFSHMTIFKENKKQYLKKE